MTRQPEVWRCDAYLSGVICGPRSERGIRMLNVICRLQTPVALAAILAIRPLTIA